MHITTVDNTSSSSLSSSMSETSSILSSISSCCSHEATNFDSNADTSSGGGNSSNIRTSLQFILNQNQNNNNSLDYWDFNNNSEEEEELNSEYDDNHYYYDSHYPDSLEYNQYIHTSHGKLVPPSPPTPMEMDLLEDNQILSSDEFNSIFESFTAVVEGHNHDNIVVEDGCLRSVNCSNGFLDDEQLSKALGAIAMI